MLEEDDNQENIAIKDENDAMIAVTDLFSVGKSKSERARILELLLAAPTHTVSVLPTIVGSLNDGDYDLKFQKQIFIFLLDLQQAGVSLARASIQIATFTLSKDPDIAGAALEILERLGEKAKSAEKFALGLLRNPQEKIILIGLGILRAIGSKLTPGSSENINSVAKAHPNSAAIQKLSNEILQIFKSESIKKQFSGFSVENIPQNAFLGKNCLFVEDGFLIRSTISGSLRMYGMEVDEAGTYEEFTIKIEDNFASKNPYDIFLVDLCLPDTNGIDLIKFIRNQKAYEYAVIIILSGITKTEIKKAALQCGASKFINKSCDVKTILERIYKTLTEYGAV